MKPVIAAFPATRLRRLRRSPAIRALVMQSVLAPQDFIWPVFVREGEGVVEPVVSMPGVNRLSVDKVVEAAREAYALGIPAMLNCDARIVAACGDCGEGITLAVMDGEVVGHTEVIHFAVPAARWWQDIVFT